MTVLSACYTLWGKEQMKPYWQNTSPFSLELFIWSLSQSFFDMINQRLKTEETHKSLLDYLVHFLGHMYNYVFPIEIFSRTLSAPFPVDFSECLEVFSGERVPVRLILDTWQFFWSFYFNLSYLNFAPLLLLRPFSRHHIVDSFHIPF